jgi:hypothetical protein
MESGICVNGVGLCRSTDNSFLIKGEKVSLQIGGKDMMKEFLKILTGCFYFILV